MRFNAGKTYTRAPRDIGLPLRSANDMSSPKFSDDLRHCLDVVRALGGRGFAVAPVERSYRVRT